MMAGEPSANHNQCMEPWSLLEGRARRSVSCIHRSVFRLGLPIDLFINVSEQC